MSRPPVLLLLLAASLPLARGQDPRASAERRLAEPGPDGPRALPDASLRLPRLRWAPRDDFLPQVSLRRLPPGSLVIRYAGIDAFVVRRVQGRLRDLWRRSLRDAWEGGVLDDEGYEEEVGRMYDALAEHRAGGRWWERSWRDSLVPERGGAPAAPYEHRVGRRVELRLGPLVLTNELRGYVDRVAIFPGEAEGARILREGEPEVLAREDAWLFRERRDPEDALAGDEEALEAHVVRARFEPPAPVLLRARWRLTLRPSISVRYAARAEDAVRDVRMRASLELYRAASQLRFIDVEVVARYRPDSGEVTVFVQLVLFTW